MVQGSGFVRGLFGVCLTGGTASDCPHSGFRVQGSGFRIQGSRFRSQGARLRVEGCGVWCRVRAVPDGGGGIGWKGQGPGEDREVPSVVRLRAIHSQPSLLSH